MAEKDWTKLFKDYKGQWVALKDDEITVVAHDRAASKVIEKAEKKGYVKPILFKVPSKNLTYIG